MGGEMTELRRHARFQLIVAGLTAVAVVGMLVTTGNVLASLAGFAVMGLLGLRALPGIRRRKRRPVQDERDEVIMQKAVTAGYSALWAFLVVWGVTIPLVFESADAVPMEWVVPMVWTGWWLVILVRGVTILILDGRGS